MEYANSENANLDLEVTEDSLLGTLYRLNTYRGFSW